MKKIANIVYRLSDVTVIYDDQTLETLPSDFLVNVMRWKQEMMVEAKELELTDIMLPIQL